MEMERIQPAIALSSIKTRKRQRTQTRYNPWKDSFELDSCGQDLLLAATPADDGHKIRIYRALQLVQTWKLRSNETLPHAIDTTYSLAQALYLDMTASIDYSHPASCLSNDSILRPMFAMALIRGINGLADILQQQRAYAGSVASLCKELGLPGWLVDLRHDAAHNDLPSRSTLRLAAQTFLSYLGDRFWKPLSEAHSNQRQEATKLLMDYEEGAKLESAAKSTTDATPPEEVPQEPQDTNESDDGDTSDDEGQEEPTEMDLLWGRNVGKSFNRFAALETKKKQKTKQPIKRIKRKTLRTPNALLDLAHQYVKKIPMDVGMCVALSFFIWGGIADEQAQTGALVPGSIDNFPCNQGGVDRIRHRYKPLLFALAQAWPGFMHSFLVHLVDCSLSIEGTADPMDDGAIRKLYFLSSWIRFSLSRDFHRCHDRSLSLLKGTGNLGQITVSKWQTKERDFMESPAPLKILQLASLPLNSICDRCDEASGKNSQELASLFVSILGNERSANYGIDFGKNTNIELLDAAKVDPTQKEVNLLEDNQPLTPCLQTTKVNWIQCTSWDPCAIGSLPGRPV